MVKTAIANGVPAGLSLALLSDEPGLMHAAARQFCLDVIKEFYGFDYRQDWHADIDSLLRPAAENHYSSVNRGAFWTLNDSEGRIQATAGIRHLGWKPNLVAAFADRYGDGLGVASLWRVYVLKNRRGQGLGSWLNAFSEREAVRRGYSRMYLHATSDAIATLAFWRASGYGDIGEFSESIHFDKHLSPSSLVA